MAEVATSTSEDSLLDAARASILAVGWRRTTLTEIARRAGVSRMTIYRSWPDMQTLLGDLMTREWLRVDSEAVKQVGAPRAEDPGLPSVIAGLVVHTVRALRRDPLWTRIVEIDPELLLPYLLDRRGRSQEATLERLHSAISAGVAAGTLRQVDPQTASRALVLAAHGFVLSAHTMVDGEESAEDLYVQLGVIVERFLTP